MDEDTVSKTAGCKKFVGSIPSFSAYWFIVYDLIYTFFCYIYIKMKCSFGCNKEALFYFKNGNGCCEASPNKCEAKRKKDSDSKKGEFKGIPYWKTKNPIYIPWNKNKIGIFSKEHISNLKKASKGKHKCACLTEEQELERRRKISSTMKLNPNSGGLRKGSGRGKNGWYKGYWCDSSWELAWVIYHLEHKIKFDRNNEFFEYIFENKKRKYYPDFIVEGVYYEVKGRRCYEKLDEQTKEKIKQFNKKLLVLFEKDMKKYISYAILKYGKNYCSLYDKD